jgi:RHS repeat-associated protein
MGYDADGQRVSMTDGTGSSSWTWDSLHRMIASTDGAGNTVQYGYDLRGSMTSLTYPGMATPVTYRYSAAAQLVGITDFAGATTTVNVNADGTTGNIAFPSPNQGIDFFTYDHAGRLASQRFTIGNLTTYATLAYGRDADGQVASETDSGLPSPAAPAYTYNSLNQVASASGAPYAYDAADNLVGRSDGTSQAFDAANEVCWTSPSGGTGTCASPPTDAQSFGYDQRGNRTTGLGPTGTVIYGFDEAGHLVSTSLTTMSTETYNGDGLRTHKTVGGGRLMTQASFTWDVHGSLPLLLADGTTRYIYGPGGMPLEQVTSSTTNYFHHDQLGSTRALTDANGTTVATYTYDAYGKLSASTGSMTNPFMFAGQYFDSDSGLYYLRARYYDPSTGQFLSRDPLVDLTREPYGYVHDNPLNFTDPSGLCDNGGAQTQGENMMGLNMLDKSCWDQEGQQNWQQLAQQHCNGNQLCGVLYAEAANHPDFYLAAAEHLAALCPAAAAIETAHAMYVIEQAVNNGDYGAALQDTGDLGAGKGWGYWRSNSK